MGITAAGVAAAAALAGVALQAKEGHDTRKQTRRDRETQKKREAIANLQRAAAGDTALTPTALTPIPKSNLGASLAAAGQVVQDFDRDRVSAQQKSIDQSNTEASQRSRDAQIRQQQAQFQQSQQLRALIAASQLGQEDPMRQTFLRDGLGVQTGPLPQDPFLQTVGGRLNRQ